jgi:Mrp family chromosome partitioning ATPase
MARNRRTERLFSLEDPKSIVSEAFRTLRTNIQYANIDKDIKSITVTSPSQREGKSTVSANLAFSLAESGKKTLIVDCDMRKPRLMVLQDILWVR